MSGVSHHSPQGDGGVATGFAVLRHTEPEEEKTRAPGFGASGIESLLRAAACGVMYTILRLNRSVSGAYSRSNAVRPYFKVGGEGGIRTPGSLLAYTAFPVLHLRPLGHLSLMQ